MLGQNDFLECCLKEPLSGEGDQQPFSRPRQGVGLWGGSISNAWEFFCSGAILNMWAGNALYFLQVFHTHMNIPMSMCGCSPFGFEHSITDC